MRIILLALFAALVTIAFGNSAFADPTQKNDTYEAKAVHAFLLYCLPALTAGDSVARVAEMQKLPELPSAAEAAFLSGKTGKVFALPEVGAGAVLTAPSMPLCSVLIQQLDASGFTSQVDFWFDPKNTPFHLDENTRLPNGEIHRKYTGVMHDRKILILINLRPQPVPGGIQAMLTAGVSSN